MIKVWILFLKYSEVYMYKVYFNKFIYIFLIVNLGFVEVFLLEEWIEIGEKFMKKLLFNIVVICFWEVGEFEMEKIVKCY